MLKSKKDNPNGLHAKFFIQKITENGLKPVHDNAEYFLLRLDEYQKDITHLKACRIGIHAYADAIESKIPKLAADLRERYPLI